MNDQDQVINIYINSMNLQGYTTLHIYNTWQLNNETIIIFGSLTYLHTAVGTLTAVYEIFW